MLNAEGHSTIFSAANIRVNRYRPPLQQPLRDVGAVFVALAPLPQFFRGHAILLRSIRSLRACSSNAVGSRGSICVGRPLPQFGFPRLRTAGEIASGLVTAYQ